MKIFFMLLVLSVLDCGLGALNVTCKLRRLRWHEPSDEGHNICLIQQFPISNPRQKKFSFEVGYAKPDDIKYVEFAATAGRRYLQNATVVQYIPKDIFTSFPNLRNFEMATYILELSPGDFQHATFLIELRLSHNMIKQIRNGVFSSHSENFSNDEKPPCQPSPMEFLEDLYLDNNEIYAIQPNSFKGLRSLTGIHLGHNKLRTINGRTFAGLPNLQRIILSENSIELIEVGALDLPKLNELFLRSNKLIQLPDTIIDRLPALEYLNLDENRLKRLSDTAFKQLSNLKDLSLQYNNLEYIGKSLYGLRKVNEITLKGNHIQDIDLIAFAHMPRLRSLDLAESGFTFGSVNIKEEEQWNSILRWLDISKNNLSNAMDLTKLRVFPYLKILSLDGNPFNDFEVGDNRTLKDVLPLLEVLATHDIVLSCEYRLAIAGRYKSTNVSVSSLRDLNLDCPTSTISTLHT